MIDAARNKQHTTSGAQRIEWIAFAAVVVLAAFFRFYALDSIPPGLHYDEAIDAHLAQDIRAGARPVYFEQGWGREPLYHYLVALAMNWASPARALRVTSAVLGTLFSVYLTFLELFVIRAVCMWCLSSAAIMALLMLVSLPPALASFGAEE